MESLYVYVVYTADAGTKLGEFDDIRNAMIFIEAYYYEYHSETFNLVISRQERKQL